ncbi:MAG: tyrosine-type recombinase/integrase, partial [Pseudonocardiaceae bacterium]
AVRNYIDDMRDVGAAATTITDRLGALRRTMVAAVEAGLRGDDPTVGVAAPRATDRPRRILTEQELALVLAKLPGWLRPAALLSHDAGLRIGEIAGLRLFRLDLLHRSVEVADVVDLDQSLRASPKGGKVLTVPLTARVVGALTGHLRDHPAGKMAQVFRDPRTGGGVTPERIRGHWRQAREAAALGEPAPRWHDLRHGCATALARSGAPAYVIQAVLRHQDLATSQRYIDRTGMASAAGVYLDRAFGETTIELGCGA